MDLYKRRKYVEAISYFLRVYKECPHSYMVTRCLLECILHSETQSHIHDGMIIIKSVLQNAAIYIHNSMVIVFDIRSSWK